MAEMQILQEQKSVHGRDWPRHWHMPIAAMGRFYKNSSKA
jgi:hypothetical protein